ncbi:transposase [Methanoculleus sp.]|jgi:transposase|uniref:transposase n=1 Tax=Methanoculleus sp. TaxID=90427 RepID=UPI001BD3AB79|nr:transposase [Methanoculleus sp.]
MITSADAAYYAREIRQYDRNRGIRSNIPVNRRNRKHPIRGRPIKFDPEAYRKRSAVERFFSGIERSRRFFHDTGDMSTHSRD